MSSLWLPSGVKSYDHVDQLTPEKFQMVRDRLKCPVCFTEYPAPVGPENTRRIMREKSVWGKPDEQAENLLREYACGVCATSMHPDDLHKYLTETDPAAV